MTANVRCPRCLEVFEVAEERLGRNTECQACGIWMTARPVALEGRLERMQSRMEGGRGADVERLPLTVVVDNVRSLWNVGSIFRTADAFGVSELVLCGITGCPPRPQIAKTALGADRSVAWRYVADSHRAVEELVEQGWTPVALESSERAQGLDEIDWPERVCLVIGNEVAGISPALLDSCPLHARIPMLGIKDSLNVAVAFGIAAHDVSRALNARRSTRIGVQACR